MANNANPIDELLALISEQDRAAVSAALDRSPAAKERMETSLDIFSTLVDGDDAKIEAAQKKYGKPAETAVTPPVTTTAASASLDDILAALTPRIEQKFKSQFRSDADLEALAEKVALKVATAEAPKIYASALSGANEIYTVRNAHQKEFGEDLDTGKFTEFLNANPGKYANLAAAHDAMVADARVKAQIAKGIEEYKVSQATGDVPGTATTAVMNKNSYQTPLGAMLKFNGEQMAKSDPVAGNGAARGEMLDKAVRAFQAIRAGHTS